MCKVPHILTIVFFLFFCSDDGCIVPLGKPKDTGVDNPSGYTLNYNEFIVYDVSQVKLKYLVKVKFNFK